jgi:predicted metal-dependent phosphoesterase TrpH
VPSGRSFADLHCHSSASFDSLAEPRKMLEKARRIGLTHLAITDHERIDGAQRARDLGIEGVQVIVGEEVKSRDGDMIGLFLEEAVHPGMDAADTAAAITEQGGIVGLPHPFDGLRSSGGSQADGSEATLERLASLVDYVEVHNARAYRDSNPLAGAYAHRHALPGLASSDSHSIMEIGIASTVLPGPFETASEFKAMLPDATIVPGRASYYIRLWTPISKLVQRTRGNRRIVSASTATPGGPSS